ncbi:MAG: carboxypeptidase regulatory-like domain-containing protein [Myxococcales bacterium]|nr:carboxypeptidase regulatory-like domain-containing protein [Myxococcales bacterium]
MIRDYRPTDGAPALVTVSVALPGTAHPVRSARVSPEGRWELTMVPGLPLRVAATVPGQIATSLAIDAPEPCAKKVYELELGVGAATRIHGTVADVFGGPIAGAEVDLIPRGHQNGFGFAQPIYRTGSDDEGNFEILVPASRYVVRGAFPGYAAATVGADTQQRDGAKVDLVLSPAASISGRVVNGEGVGVDQAELRLVALSGGSAYVNYAGRAVAVSGPGGLFRIDDVAFGSWAIYARSGESVSSAPTEVAIALYDQLEDVVVTVDSGTPVYGTVRVRGQDTPVAAALVTLEGSGVSTTCSPSDDTGLFDCGVVPRGSYNAIVSHDRYAGNLLGGSVSVGAEQTYLELEVEPGYTVSGRVSPAAEGVEVRVRMGAESLTMNDMGYSMMNAFRMAQTDRDGRFSIGPLALGELTLIAEHQRFGHGEVVIDRARAEAGAEVEIPLTPAASLVGQLGGLGATDATTLEVVLTAVDEPQRIDGTRRAGAPMYTIAVGADGSFSATGIEAGRYGLSLRHSLGTVGFTGPDSLELSDGQRERIELELTAQQQRFAGVVVDADGGAVEGAVVYARRDPAARAVSDVDGSFTLVAWSEAPVLPVGFHRAGYSTAAGEAELQAGAGNQLQVPSELSLDVAHAGVATGRLVLAGKTRIERPLARSGATTVTGLLPGDYQVHVCGDDEYGVAKVALTEAGAKVQVETRPWRKAVGKAITPEGAPLVAGQVIAMPTRDPCNVFGRAARASFTGEVSRTDEEGGFELGGLPPGPTVLFFIDGAGEAPRELTLTVDIADGEGTHDLGDVQL